jgi:small conductance mechanosensitive channel
MSQSTSESPWLELNSLLDLNQLTGFFLSWTPKLLASAFVMFLFWAGYRLLKRAIDIFSKRAGIDSTIVALIQSIQKIVLLSIGAVSALGQVGVDITALIASLGVAGLTIGFAAKDALSNMISGFFILWDRPFTIGDLIEIGESYGRVESITMRSTRVVTMDGRMVAIPNSEVVNKPVASYTNSPHLRLDISFTVAVTENISNVRKIALGICEGNTQLMSEPSPIVVVTELNDYNIGMQLQAWIIDERAHIPIRFALREALFEALREGNIDMPFETFSLTPIEMSGDKDKRLD